jgi:hypothetical protein
VVVSSEQSLYPIDNIFDDQRGPGGSCWVAANAGEAVVTIAFDSPQTVETVSIESEEFGGARTQDIVLALSRDGGRTYVDEPKRTVRFTPYGTTFQRETWKLDADDTPITHMRLRVTPGENSSANARASLTSLIVR